ncbi:4'-phosphopantetheinyl transferase family protein [Actinocrinis sp.]|uniref:4'-phosphopantetheinyl transferase family protein n=1 Tax=Actinocrinis sp. TaxID=1920516 RepID=UPI002B89C703|nr:4'-phosphopantetheinyl transferase superfamily protein [Actinocrinis sp.]HXR72243.1 4'-phosphopantetheinyl transferase superfamily protein [Actinocrinis sp.]
MTELPDRASISAALQRGMALDPARPLHLCHVPGPLTVAVVSIAWLAGLPDAARAALELRELHPQEATHATTLWLLKRRLEWVAGRLAASRAVRAHQRRHLGHEPGPRRVKVSQIRSGPRAGKPTVNAPVQVGLSHSGDFAVAACGPRPIGVDLERTRPMPPPLLELLAAADPIDGAPECRALAQMAPSLHWACKEAVLKQVGIGLRMDPREVTLTGWRPDGLFSWRAGADLRRCEPAAAADDDGRFTGWAREIDGYSLALVWK